MKWSILYIEETCQQCSTLNNEVGTRYRMLFLLDLLHSAILEGPLDNVGFVRDTLDMMALVELCPELVEVLELDQMPDLGKRGGNDGGLCD